MVSAQGDIIVDPVYEKITWEAIPFEDNEYGHKMIFKCKVLGGPYEIKNWDPRKKLKISRQAALEKTACYITVYSDLHTCYIPLPHQASGLAGRR